MSAVQVVTRYYEQPTTRRAPATAAHLVEVLGLRVGSQEELETGGRVERLQHEGIGLE